MHKRESVQSRFFIKILSISLALIIGFSGLPTSNVFAMEQIYPEVLTNEMERVDDENFEVFVKEKDPTQLQAELDNMIYEIVSLREENVKHFHLADGTYQAVTYGQPVHTQNEDGTWEDIDNTLSVAGDEITTNNARVKFAKKITGNDNIFTFHEGNYKITFGLRGAIKNTEGSYVNTVTHFNEGTSKLQKLTTLDKLSANVIYENILPDVDVEYILNGNNIKENIIVKRMFDEYIYTFAIKLNGLNAQLEDNSVLIYDATTNEEIYRIPAPYMYDAEGKACDNVFFDLIDSGNGKYELVITADQQWINASERAFPVVIDPSFVDITQIEDTFVYSAAASTNYGSSADLWVLDTAEAYYRFNTPGVPNGSVVKSATLKIPYYYNVVNSKYMSMGIFKITSNWTESSVTWNSKPSTATYAMDVKAAYANGASATEPGYISFGVTSYVKSWYTGTPNYGFAIKREEGTNSSVILVAREKGSLYAQLTINYERQELKQGVYAVNNAGTNKYLKSTSGQGPTRLLQDVSQISAPIAATDLENLFKIVYREEYDDYIIRGMSDNALVVYPSVYNNGPMAEKLTTSNQSLSTTYGWKLLAVGTYYYITYTENDITYYARSVSENQDAAIQFTTNPNDNGTLWNFVHYTGADIATVEKVNIVSSIRKNDTYQFKVLMRSTNMSHNGPVRYSVRNLDWSETDKATIGLYTGVLTAKEEGEFFFCATYDGAPYLWAWKVKIASTSGWIKVEDPTINPRSSWNPMDQIKLSQNLRNRAPVRIVFHHSAEKFSSTDENDIKQEIKRIQNLHMVENQKSDIAYHFIIDPAGGIWVGAEIDEYLRGHTQDYFDDIGVLVLGDFESRVANFWNPNVLNAQQKNAMIVLAKWLCYKYDLSMIKTGDALAPITTHRELNNTVCPGDNMAPWVENELRPLIQDWNVEEYE